MFPVIYNACNYKQASITEMISDGRWVGSFKHHLNTNEHMELDLLRRDLGASPFIIYGDDEFEFLNNFSSSAFYDALARKRFNKLTL